MGPFSSQLSVWGIRAHISANFHMRHICIPMPVSASKTLHSPQHLDTYLTQLIQTKCACGHGRKTNIHGCRASRPVQQPTNISIFLMSEGNTFSQSGIFQDLSKPSQLRQLVQTSNLTRLMIFSIHLAKRLFKWCLYFPHNIDSVWRFALTCALFCCQRKGEKQSQCQCVCQHVTTLSKLYETFKRSLRVPMDALQRTPLVGAWYLGP